MGIFSGRSRSCTSIPEGFSSHDVRTEASVCTGERLIGFYSAADRKLHYAEVVRTDADIGAFLRRYGIDPAKGDDVK